MRIAPLTEQDGPQALAVNRACPMEADFRFYFEREPDFFRWPRRVFDDVRYLGSWEGEKLLGYAMVARKRGWTGEDWGSFAYGGDLRLVPERRGQGGAEALIRDCTASAWDDLEVGFGIVKRGNRATERHLAQVVSTPGVWEWRLAGRLVVHNLLFVPRPVRGSVRVRTACPRDLEGLLALQQRCFRGRLFAPEPSHDRLQQQLEGAGDSMETASLLVAERGGRLVGALGLQDLDSMHRARVLRLTWRAKLARWAHRVARLRYPGMAPLPDAGGVLRSLMVVDLAVEGREPVVLDALVAAALQLYQGRGYHLLQVALMEHDPLCEGLGRYLRLPFDSTLAVTARPAWWARHSAAVGDPYIDPTLL